MESALREHLARDVEQLASPLLGGKSGRHLSGQTLDFKGIT